MMIVDNVYTIGQTVYLKTDADQAARVVTGFIIRAAGYITYELSCGTSASWHCDFEIATEKDVSLSIGG